VPAVMGRHFRVDHDELSGIVGGLANPGHWLAVPINPNIRLVAVAPACFATDSVVEVETMVTVLAAGTAGSRTCVDIVVGYPVA